MILKLPTFLRILGVVSMMVVIMMTFVSSR